MFMRNNRGSVLIYLLFIIAVISYMVLDYSQNTRIRLQLSGNFYAKTQKRLDLSNLAILVSLKYFDKDPNFTEFDEDKQIISREIKYNGNIYFIQLIQESELVDINGKDETVIRNEINENLEDFAEPEKLESIADAIFDWIDSDNDTRLHGAENEDYDVPFFPYNKKFKSISELKLVKGVEESGLYFKMLSDEDGNYSFKGLFTLFTVWKNGAEIFSVKKNKLMNYKNVLRIYVKTDNNLIYVYFTGINNGKVKVFKHYRLI